MFEHFWSSLQYEEVQELGGKIALPSAKGALLPKMGLRCANNYLDLHNVHASFWVTRNRPINGWSSLGHWIWVWSKTLNETQVRVGAAPIYAVDFKAENQELNKLFICFASLSLKSTSKFHVADVCGTGGCWFATLAFHDAAWHALSRPIQYQKHFSKSKFGFLYIANLFVSHSSFRLMKW